MNTRALLVLSVAALISSISSGLPVRSGNESGKPQISRLSVETVGDDLEISFQLTNALRPGLLEQLKSGVPLQFRHRVELRERRAIPIWTSRLLSRTVIETRARYDSLTRRYTLSRKISTRESEKNHEPSLELQQTTESEKEMRAWMTRIESVRMRDPSRDRRRRRLKIHVESALERRLVMWMFPSTLTVSAEWRLGS